MLSKSQIAFHRNQQEAFHVGQTVSQKKILREKFRPTESLTVSQDRVVKLARKINSRYHCGFDDAAFCRTHGI